jgi:hypothetical protein
MRLGERPFAVAVRERVRARERLGEVVVRVEHELGQQLVAVAEVAVQRRAGDPELARDRVDRDGLRAAGRQLGERDPLYGCPHLIGSRGR